MASYHLRVKSVSRSEGRSATAAAAYRSGSRIECAREGKTHDYERKGGVESTVILAPEDAPEWAKDRASLWNAAEAAEKRKNSVVAREWEIALPSELDAGGRRELAEGFAAALVERYGIAADVAIHGPHREGDERNHHAHILTTTRRIGPDGLGEKTRVLDVAASSGPELETMRGVWAEMQNRALERAGVSARVDHRTLEAQRESALEAARAARSGGEAERGASQEREAAALDRPPEPRLGETLNAMERKARREAEASGRAYEPISARGAQVIDLRDARARRDAEREREERAQREAQAAREVEQRAADARRLAAEIAEVQEIQRKMRGLLAQGGMDERTRLKAEKGAEIAQSMETKFWASAADRGAVEQALKELRPEKPDAARLEAEQRERAAAQERQAKEAARLARREELRTKVLEDFLKERIAAPYREAAALDAEQARLWKEVQTSAIALCKTQEAAQSVGFLGRLTGEKKRLEAEAERAERAHVGLLRAVEEAQEKASACRPDQRTAADQEVLRKGWARSDSVLRSCVSESALDALEQGRSPSGPLVDTDRFAARLPEVRRQEQERQREQERARWEQERIRYDRGRNEDRDFER